MDAVTQPVQVTSKAEAEAMKLTEDNQDVVAAWIDAKMGPWAMVPGAQMVRLVIPPLSWVVIQRDRGGIDLCWLNDEEFSGEWEFTPVHPQG